jgi:RNA 3'-terminal phosphate cyclase (ATP)
MALAKGKSTVVTGPWTLHTKFVRLVFVEQRLKLHPRTAIWLAEKLTHAKFHIQDEHGTGRIILSCEGIGLEPTSPLNSGEMTINYELSDEAQPIQIPASTSPLAYRGCLIPR